MKRHWFLANDSNLSFKIIRVVFAEKTGKVIIIPNYFCTKSIGCKMLLPA